MSRSARNRAAHRAVSRSNTAPIQGSIPARTLLHSEVRRLASATPVLPSGQGIRKGKRIGSDKGQDLWRTTSQNYFTAATIDSRWTNHGI